MSLDPLSPVTAVFLSRESEYGLEGLAVLAQRPGGTVMLLHDIAQARSLPVGFLARIFQKLRRHNLVASHRGAVRGYALTRRASEISLLELFEAIEGPHLFSRCIFRGRHCGQSGACRRHGWWAPLAARLRQSLARTTLADAAGVRPRPHEARLASRSGPEILSGSP